MRAPEIRNAAHNCTGKTRNARSPQRTSDNKNHFDTKTSVLSRAAMRLTLNKLATLNMKTEVQLPQRYRIRMIRR
jgi:hypothetical protein